MEKKQLALALRQRQYHLALTERHIIDKISDDEIIDRYITCSDCGEKQVSPQELKIAIRLAATAEQFFDLCESIAHARAIAFASMQSTRKPKARRR